MKTPTIQTLLLAAALAGATATPVWAQQAQSNPSSAQSSISALGAKPLPDATLYNDLGGLEVLTKVVDDTLALALADERIKDTFKNSDMKRLAKMLTEQFCELSGGPCKYSGDPMKEVHQGLALNNMHFNALVEDLQAAMDKANIPSRTQNKLLALLAPMQRTVVTK